MPAATSASWGEGTPTYVYFNNKQQDLGDQSLKNIGSTKIYFVELAATVCLYSEQNFLMLLIFFSKYQQQPK